MNTKTVVIGKRSRRAGAGNKLRIPEWLPERGWSLTEKGYAQYNYTHKLPGPKVHPTTGIRRNTRAHRAVMERLLGRPLEPDEYVHHQDFDKLNCCPCNLVLLGAALNPTPSYQCPITGRFMSAAAYVRRYGALPTRIREIAEEEEVPF